MVLLCLVLLPEEGRCREEVELLLHVAPYLLCNDKIRVGINQSSSAIAIDVTRCQVSMAMFTLNFAHKFQELESFNVALFFDDLLGMITDRRKCSSFQEELLHQFLSL